MKYDFTLGKNGDILFKQSDRSTSSLQFDFYIAKSEGLVLDFYIDSNNEEKYLSDLKPSFEFNFRTNIPSNNKDVMCITNKQDYLHQQIKIRLSSAIGTMIANENIGSYLDNYRHILLNPEKDKGYDELISCVKMAISDILPNAQVGVKKKPSIYTDFTNSLVISITQDDFNFYYYL